MKFALLIIPCMPVEKLPFKKQVSYACGMIGWSIMMNVIIVMLVYFYLPPNGSGLMPLVPQFVVFAGLNIMALIPPSGRLVDAFIDPFIASLSDKSKNKRGRRIPFMKWAILPSVLFCWLTFVPIDHFESMHNAWWLMAVLALFFIATTTYIIPYYALLPELTDTAAEKVKLSSFQQVGYVIGIIISALVNNYADLVQRYFHVANRDTALQYTIGGLAVLSGIVMLVPVLSIDERKYVVSKQPSHLPIGQAIRKTFVQSNFIYYLISDFSYNMALSIIASGLLFFVTVLLPLPASIGGLLMLVMVLGSLVFYPLINYVTNKIGKKPLVLISFAILCVIFAGIYFLGKFPASPKVQIFTLVLLAAFPLAALGILPNAILAEIAERDSRITGENREGMYYAVKLMFVKFGQTLGMALFAFLTIYGKDAGHDFGLRLNGIVGFVLCLFAFISFTRFKEKKVKAKRKGIPV